MTDRLRLLIIGAGAIGGTLAHALRAGADVSIADADPRVREAFGAQGFNTLAPDALASADRSADAAILALRAAIVPGVLDRLPAGLAALCLSNGIHAGLGAQRPGATLLGCVDFAASPAEPGRPRLTQKGGLTMPAQSPGDITTRLAACLAGSPITPHLTPDIAGAIWSKAILNASLDPAAALSGRTIGGAFAHQPAFALLRRLLSEGRAVARAAGITLHPVQGTAISTMVRVFHTPVLNRIAATIAARKARDVESTMLADLRRGAVTETQFLNGAIADTAARLGRTDLAPTHRAVTQLLAQLHSERRPPSDADLQSLLVISR